MNGRRTDSDDSRPATAAGASPAARDRRRFHRGRLLVVACILFLALAFGGVGTVQATAAVDDGGHGGAVATVGSETLDSETLANDTENRTNATVTVAYEGDRLTVRRTHDQVVHGTTTLPPGTTLVVRADSAHDDGFLKARQVTVSEDGGFAATFDFAEVTAVPQRGTLTVLSTNGTALVRVPVRVVDAADAAGTTRLAGSVVTADLDTTARIPVLVEPGGRALLSVGGEAVGYEVNATVSDENRDGRVVVLFDVAAAGDPDTPTLRTDGTTDVVEVRPGSEVALDAGLKPGQYPMTLSAGGDGTTNASATLDRGTLVLQAPQTTTAPSTTQEPTGTSTETTAMETVRSTSHGTTSSASQPGFGPGLALFGLLLGLLLLQDW